MWLDKLKSLKRQSGKTIDQISEESGISKGTINKIFAGQTKDPQYTTLNDIENAKLSPTLAQLERIAAALDCQMWQLFDSPYNNVRDHGHFDKNVEIKVKNAKI